MNDEVQLFVICATSDIPAGEAKAFSLSRVTPDGPRPYSIFVVHTKDNQFLGYLNLCPHAGAWLNIGEGSFFNDDRSRLRCGPA